jgi:hypothetical protein
MQAKTKKIVIISSIIGVAALAGGIFLFGKRKSLEAKIKAGNTDVLGPAKGTGTMTMFPLKKGSGVNTAEKNAVKVVQRYLNAKSTVYSWLAVLPLAEDGSFGPLTESALSKLAGVTQVSYSFYLDMQSFLASGPSTVPEYLDPSAPGYSGATGLDPKIIKNNLL